MLPVIIWSGKVLPMSNRTNAFMVKWEKHKIYNVSWKGIMKLFRWTFLKRNFLSDITSSESLCSSGLCSLCSSCRVCRGFMRGTLAPRGLIAERAVAVEKQKEKENEIDDEQIHPTTLLKYSGCFTLAEHMLKTITSKNCQPFWVLLKK